MDKVMDSQDLVGYIRGLCLLTIAHRATGGISRGSAERVANDHILEKLVRFADALCEFTGIDRCSVVTVMNPLIASDVGEAFFESHNVNIQLSLLSGRPIPPYPFVSQSGVDSVALARPYLDVSTNLLHAAVRLRMQGTFPLVGVNFWPAAILFLDCMWGPSFTSRFMACATVINVASDVLFYNLDIGTRVSDLAVIARADAVMTELREVIAPIEQYARSPMPG